MSRTVRHKIQVGDWVSGTSVLDERFIGFVVSKLQGEGKVNVHVIESDRSEAVGSVVESSIAKVYALPESEPSYEDLLSLIDMALAAHDETWFSELTAKLLNASNRTTGVRGAAFMPTATGPKFNSRF
jgi:hypothetical protein